MNLVEFYKEWVESMKLGVDEDGGLYVKSKSRGKLPLLQDGIKMVLPTASNIRNALEPDKDGNLVLTKFLFNPLQESVYRGENKSLLRMRKHVDRITSNSLMVSFEILIRILSDKSLDVEDLKIIKVIEELKKYKSTGLKNIVDDDTAKNIFKIYRSLASGPENSLPVHTYLKRGGKVDGEKVNRLGVVTFPLLEVFDKATVKDEIYGVKLRNKDLNAYKVLYKIVFDDCEYETLLNGITFKSKDSYSPGSDVVLQMYSYLANKINSFIDSILTVGKYTEELEEAKLNVLPIDLKDFKSLFKKLAVEVDKVPDKDSLENIGAEDNKNRVFSGVTNNVDDKAKMSDYFKENRDTKESVEVDKEVSAMDVILGKKTQQAQQPMSNEQSLFGNNRNASNQQSMFGNQQSSAFGTQGQNSLFGNQQSMFGNQQSSLFGNQQQTSLFNKPNVTSLLNNF